MQPVTSAWAQYAAFWQPYIVLAGVWAIGVLVLLLLIVVKLYRK